MPSDVYLMGMAKEASKNSKCLSRQIGAVIVRDGRVVSTGYNGPPENFPHCNERYNLNICPRKHQGFKSGQGLHLCPAAHAERNAIVSAARLGIAVKGATLYVYCDVVCKECLIEIVNAGITRLVWTHTPGEPLNFYDELFKELYEFYSSHGFVEVGLVAKPKKGKMYSMSINEV